MPTTTDTIKPTDTTASPATAEARPIPASDTATRGEPRGAARMNSTAPETPYRWQADGTA